MSVLNAVTTVIPPPQFLQMTTLGVDISDTSLKYVLLHPDRTSGRQLELRQWGDIDIPPGVLERGQVSDVTALGTVLKELREKTGARLVRVSLPEERAYIFETEIAASTSAKEIRGQVEFRLEENVPSRPRCVLTTTSCRQ